MARHCASRTRRRRGILSPRTSGWLAHRTSRGGFQTWIDQPRRTFSRIDP
ncbi:MAG: hypothetical protein LBT52_00095 [Clostridiales Family XIII bacterium]|nr:hypothetical protein [Clostridiales Family XIII bacterium]